MCASCVYDREGILSLVLFFVEFVIICFVSTIHHIMSRKEVFGSDGLLGASGRLPAHLGRIELCILEVSAQKGCQQETHLNFLNCTYLCFHPHRHYHPCGVGQHHSKQTWQRCRIKQIMLPILHYGFAV